MFIEATTIPAYGARLDILLTLPTTLEELRLPGVVRWTKAHGFGLQFLELGARETYAIASLVASERREALTGRNEP
jgi:hypothetical protein